MEKKFILSCGSTADLPYSECVERDIRVIFYTYMLDDVEYEDDMERTPGAWEAYVEKLKNGAMPKTSQINEGKYEEYFDKLLQEGDVLHIAFGTGMSGSYNNAVLAAETLKEKYPERKIIVIDSLCSQGGYALLMEKVADLRDEGKSMEEVAQWVEENKLKVQHHFFCTDISFFKRSGRMSGATAAIATILNICPLMWLNNEGRIIAYDKVRGAKNAIRSTVKQMEKLAENGTDYDGRCIITYGGEKAEAEQMEKLVRERFPKAQVRVLRIGMIISAHCGPSTTTLYFFGAPRTAENPV